MLKRPGMPTAFMTRRMVSEVEDEMPIMVLAEGAYLPAYRSVV